MPIGRHSVVWFALLSAICASFAQSNIILFPITNAWRYEQSANLDGVNWQSPSFNDAGWPSGIGLLYVESNPSVTPRNTPLTLGRITYYFRTHFQCTNSMAGVGLFFSNLVDDGAVFYLNGREIRRIRMLLPPYQPVYASTATEWPPGTDATAYDVFSLSGDALTNVIYGDNLLAVEVHQQDPGSSDIVFGTALSIAPSTGAFTFTEQPTNMTVLDGRPFVLRAGVSGEPQPALQWFKNGSIFPGATLTTLSFPSAAPSDGGTYWVVASNISMVLTSNPATITVPADNIAPAVFLAAAQKNLTNIVIDFSEPVRPGATNLANYQVVKSGQFPTGLTVISATLSNQTNLLLTTTPRTPRVNYELRLTNIVDFSSASNQVSAAPIPLKYVTDLLRIHTNAIWRYEQSGVCPAAGWFASDFDDSAWPSGGPVFFASRIGGLPPAPIGTPLQLMNLFGTAQATSYFFRAEFELPGLSTNALSLRHIIDDGAALYLNGQPFYSIRLGFNGACEAFASGSVGTPNYEPLLSQSPFSINNSALSGANVFAAEVHQSSANNNDVAFAVSLEALIDDFVPGLSLTLPAFTTNGAGVLLNAGRVTLTESASTNVMVALNSSVSSALSVPANVTVLAGETNALFNITVGSNGSTTGPRRASVNASAGGFIGATKKTVVLDSVPAVLNLVLPGSIVEGSGTFTGRVEFVAPIAQDVTVTLTSTMPGAVGVPPYTIIAAGQTSAVFQLVIPNNTLLEGTRTSTVTAHVTGWVDGIAMVSVLDKPDSYRAISLTTRDLAYDPVTQRIYASVPGSVPAIGNQIVPIAPETGAIETGFSMGGEPGKLLVASAGGKLYASVETNRMLRRADLPSRTTELSFPLETNAPSNLVIEDFELLPGSPNPVAVLRLQSSFNADVAIYDEGVRRTNVASGGGDAYQETIEVSTDGSAVYFQSFGYQGLRRLIVDGQGLTTAYIDNSITPPPYSRDWKAVGDRFFGSDGTVIDPLVPQLISMIPNIPANSPLTYDPAIQRVFYLVSSGANVIVRAYEPASVVPAGSLTISNVVGQPVSLIRWGGVGLAFRTDADRFYLLKTSLIPTNPPADIELSMAISSAPYFVGTTITETITITNRGPNTADLVSWTNTLPAGATVISTQTSAGTITVISNIIRGTMTGFGAQTAVNVSVVFQPNVPGVVTVAATVGSSASETNLGNNLAVQPLWVRDGDLSANAILNLAVKDIARDPVRSRLYFSVGSSANFFPNSILVMDFVAGTVAPLVMNGDPGRLAVSADGQFLYVALDTGSGVRRVALTSLNVDLSFSFPDARPVTDLAVCPTNVDLVAVWRQFDNSYSAYEHGALFPSGSAICFNAVGFFGDKVVNGIYYDNNGMIFDVATREFHGILPIPFNSLIEPDLAAHRIYALTVPNGVPGWALRAFDTEQFIEVGYSFATLDSPSSLLRWGNDGLVFRTATQVFLLHSSLVPTNAATDLALQATVSATAAALGALVVYQLGVTNLGTNAAFGVVVTQAFSLSVTGVVATADVGSVTNVANFITWQLPPLPPGAGGALRVSLQSAQLGTLVARAGVRHSANDPRLNNNFALNVTRIGDPSTNEIREIALTTRELVFDPLRQKIYASVPAREPFIGNSVISIDPITARIEPLCFAGSEPNQLALSDDGRFLYVSLNGTMGARRVDLAGQQPDLTFPFSLATLFNAFDMKAQPGHPDTVAVSLVDTRTSGDYPAGVFLFDNGVARPAAAGVTKSIEFSPDGLRIYGSITFGAGFGFLRLAVTASGVSEIDRTGAFYDDYDLKLQNGLLYSGLGRVIDPNIPSLLTTFGVNGPVEPDSQLGRIYQVPLSDTTTELRVYDMGSYQLLGTMALPTARPYARHLIRCGANRLTFRTDNGGQFFLLRTALASQDNDGDGMPDEWEMAFFHSTNAANGGAAQDFDGDGITNLQEYINGTDPTDASNAFRISGVSLGGGTAVFRFHGVTGIRYQLEQSPSVSGSWAATGPVVMGQGLGLFWTNALPPVSPQFYRLRQVP